MYVPIYIYLSVCGVPNTDKKDEQRAVNRLRRRSDLEYLDLQISQFS